MDRPAILRLQRDSITPPQIEPAGPDGKRSRIPFYATFGNALLDRQAAIESNARSYPRRLPVALKSGRGAFVTDVDGREYIDCLGGAGALALGHNHPAVTEAIRKALEDAVPFQTLDLATPLKERFIGELFETLPAGFAADAKIHFCGPTGADAIEAAIKLVRTATGRRSLMCFRGSYHGMTAGALSLTGDTSAKAGSTGQLPDVHFLPFPANYRCPFGIGGEAGWRLSADYIENLLDDPSSGIPVPAGMFLEVVQGEGGVNPAPDEWLRKIRDITTRHAIPLIVDEVQTGLGRTGTMFAFERSGITPDAVVLSKAIGGGLPVAVVVYHRGLDKWNPGAHAGTFRGNQLGFAAGAETIRFVRENGLDRHAQDMGGRFMRALGKIAAGAPSICDVRGRGLMTGVEIVDPEGERRSLNPPPKCQEMAQRIQLNCLRRGLIVERAGGAGNVLRFLPPLIVSAGLIDEISARFADAVRASESQREPAD
ncbi:MAG: diaminobutyrate--2-oxoglutarate transaminase [Beijerinckiaceae bacterium]|nr:diaminobutyrate--2-oxoglutarate transaminase [Beijerinckiaceae bacterium]